MSVLHPKKVLVVDDDVDYLQLVSDLLIEEGYQVLTAATGERGHYITVQENADLVIVDGKLPDTDGVDWIARFRQTFPSTPVIFASSLWYNREEVSRMKKEMGVELVLHKPLVPSMFGMQVSRILTQTTPKEVVKSSEDTSLWNQKMDKIRIEYRDRLLKRIETLYQSLFQCWEEVINGPAMKEAIIIAHRLRGSAGTFGYHLAGTSCGEIEDGLRAWRDQNIPPDWAYLITACERARKSITEESVPELETPGLKKVKDRGRILVLDDDRDFLTMVSDLLTSRGFEVVTETVPGDLKHLLDSVKPELVLLDVAMPFPDGFTVCQQLRSLPKWQWLPVLFLTVHNDLDTRIKAFRAQADDFISKPIVGEELAARIDVRLERQHLLRQHNRTISDLENSHEALYSILQQLHLGVVIVGRDGLVSFVSDSCRRLLSLTKNQALGKVWHEILPFEIDQIAQLRHLTGLPPEKRSRLKFGALINGRDLWLEVDVRNDPREKSGRILYFNDVSELYNLRAQVQGDYNRKIVGKSRPMMEMFRTMRQLSRGDWTVLIEGETGVGKELVARAIHDTSSRNKGPFIAVNCGGLSESLLSSQLFGHRRGAFSGATSNQEGFFQAADKGTLFLDEIGEIPQSVQTSLLRVLQESEITPLGEVRPRKVDVRIVAATNRTLSEEVKDGNFRQDLFYRLQVGRVKVPPLRERRQDIPLLVDYFLNSVGNSAESSLQQVSQEAMALMMEYGWPGNVRELENAISYSAIHADHDVLAVDNLPPEIREAAQSIPRPKLDFTLDEIPMAPGKFNPEEEKRRILGALHEASGNRTKAARILGMGRATLYRRLTELNLI